jgi:hypothetical protein
MAVINENFSSQFHSRLARKVTAACMHSSMPRTPATRLQSPDTQFEGQSDQPIRRAAHIRAGIRGVQRASSLCEQTNKRTNEQTRTNKHEQTNKQTNKQTKGPASGFLQIANRNTEIRKGKPTKAPYA